MRAAKTFAAALIAVALLATAAPAPADARIAYRKYVACGTSGRAEPSHLCSVKRASDGNVGAFFRSYRADVNYLVCVRFPNGGVPRCARRQTAKKGTLYVNPITSNQIGLHAVTWFVKGRRVGRVLFRLR